MASLWLVFYCENSLDCAQPSFLGKKKCLSLCFVLLLCLALLCWALKKAEQERKKEEGMSQKTFS